MQLNPRSLVLDMKVWSACDNIRINIVALRSGVVQNDGYTSQSSFVVPSGGKVLIPNVPITYRLFIYSSEALVVAGTLPSGSALTLYGQTLLMMDGGLNNLLLTNTGIVDANAVLIRFSTTNVYHPLF